MGRREDFLSLVGLLEERGIDHMLVGALAMDALGTPRSTVDVDLQVRMDVPSRGQTSWNGWFIQERSRDPVFDQRTLILHRPTHTTPFELFLTDHWFTHQALERRRPIPYERFDRDVPSPRAEDFLLLKACYWQHEERRPAKRAQDGVDIETVFEANRDEIPLSYLEENARKLGVWEDLAGLVGL